ncbi:hypothetical protein EG240_08910 [Paenimyroides tangerinum]|uniref:Uncharacterized protein n=1 Tax=Paenimyroides tangerinum TaxID=2488728 RepID=A0A3P3W5F3_9FLAO|nr:hypothetical protein [Paenimyroides tangerinum]RRJ90361.1 hypothetical protein EG240_08910 [Paenimyroides tangerinum]
MKKLTQEQIDQLFVFTKKHYVEFYDVQVELVDHLANAIEAAWEVNPNLSFDETLQAEFKKFGIFGFTGLVEQKQNELHKHYNKMLWNEIKSFFTIPKIVLTALLFFLVYYILEKTGAIGETFALAALIISFIVFMFDGFRFIFKIKKEQKKQGKSWLLQSVAQQMFSIPTIGFGGVYFSMIGRFFEENLAVSNAGIYFLTAFLVMHFLFIFVFYNLIKPSLVKSIKETEKRYQTI